MTSLYTVSILFVDQPEMTVACIQKVLETSGEDTRIVVTANGSKPADLAKVFQSFENPRLIYLINKKNLGFGEAHNRVALDALGKSVYFVPLNNDCFVTAGWLEALRRPFAEDPRLAQTGIEATCGYLRADGQGSVGPVREFIEASCMMMPTWLACRFGPFSSDYRLIYCEDADLSLRLREAGYTIKAINHHVEHTRAATTSKLAIDLEGYRVRNHMVLRTRWARYLGRRDFKYKIAVHRSGAVGDVLLTTPIIHSLKRQYAEAEIRVSTHHREVFARNPDIAKNEIEPLAYTDGYWKVVNLDMAYEREPLVHAVEAYARACNVEIDLSNPNDLPRVTVGDDERSWARQIMDREKPSVVIHTGPTAWAGRNWPLDRFQDVARMMKRGGWSVVQVGAHGAAMNETDLDLIGKTGFHQLAAVIERSSLFVGLDSMPMHLAQAFQRPLVGIFGCIDPALRLYRLPIFTGVVANDVGCLGCHHILPAPRTTSLCLRDRVYCMEKLRTQQVLEAIHYVLEAKVVGLEASKIRNDVLKYCNGKGIDIGAKDDKIRPEALGFDKNPGPGINRIGDASVRMPFEDGEFDYVFSSHALEDIADYQAALKEWIRIVKPGAYIVLYVPHPDLYHGCNWDHKHPGFTPEELCKDLLKLNCKIIEARVHDEPPDCYSTLVVGEKQFNP